MNLDKEKYLAIRHAQKNGVRTLEELKNFSNIVIENDEELKEVERVLKNVCTCKQVALQTVVDAVKNGANTVDDVKNITKAGTGCGRCEGLIESIIKAKK